jgi:hypothetical protein
LTIKKIKINIFYALFLGKRFEIKNTMKKTFLSIGHGYSAQALARELGSHDWNIIGTTRSAEKAEILRAQGIEPLIWPTVPLGPALARASHVLCSVAPDAQGCPVAEALASLMCRGRFAPKWVGYLSTTSVYGDHQSAWVDEKTPLTPTTARGNHRVLAESQWQALGLNLHIFRLAGIYGPTRGPFSKVRDGSARLIIKKNQVFSRIHVDDITQVLAASIAQPNPGAVYNVCDDLPCPPEDVIAHAATLLGLPLPPKVAFETANMTPMARSFYAESKRVKNGRMKIELGVKLIYPDYHSGLAALMSLNRLT